MPADWVGTVEGWAAAFAPEPAPGLFPELQADAASTRTIPAANPGTAFPAYPLPRGSCRPAECAFDRRAGWITCPPRSWSEAPEATRWQIGALAQRQRHSAACW